jgi:multidrug transporter EmrE-like cation transporter
MRIYALAVFSVLLSALAQTAFKFGMSRPGAQQAATVSMGEQPLKALFVILTNPAVVGGLVLYAASAMLWLLVLARLDLSVAYPMVALGFILTMLAGVLLFGESLSAARLGGTLLICVGVTLVARS